MRFLTALVLGVVMFGASCAYDMGAFSSPQAKVSQHKVEARTADIQDDEKIIELGDGYRMKRRGETTLIKFPEKFYLNDKEESVGLYRLAMDEALIKVYGEKAFDGGRPHPFTIGAMIIVEIGGKTFELAPLQNEAGDNGPYIGIALRPAPKS